MTYTHFTGYWYEAWHISMKINSETGNSVCVDVVHHYDSDNYVVEIVDRDTSGSYLGESKCTNFPTFEEALEYAESVHGMVCSGPLVEVAQ